MQQKILYVLTICATILVGLAIFSSYTGEATDFLPNLDDSLGSEQLPQVIHSVDLDQPFDFAGEALPMDNFDVRERLDREFLVNSYRHSATVQMIKLAHRYFPTFERIMAENGVPNDFKYIAVAESSLRHATSPAGAKGLWQFMKSAAADRKLEVNSEVDERFHVEKATQAACEHIKKQKERFGSWTLAAAAYNVGSANLARDVKTQRTNSYYDLNLNQETGRYLFRIVAIKTILQNPEKFGFYLEEEDLYKPLDDFAVVETNESIPNLGDFAQKYGTTYRMLKVYNPWLMTSKLTNSKKKTYQIKIPKK